MTDRGSEFHVVIDRTRALDFEVFRVDRVAGYGAGVQEEQEFSPFYLARNRDLNTQAFYTSNRVPRVLSDKERKFGQVSAYAGSEVYISLVDGQAAPYRSDLAQMNVTALCTNRHLPIQLGFCGQGMD